MYNQESVLVEILMLEFTEHDWTSIPETRQSLSLSKLKSNVL